MGGPFEIVELTAVERPPEDRADDENRRERERDEEIENVHWLES